MTATERDDVTLFAGLSDGYALVVAAASDGTRWAGTPHWLVKERQHPARERKAEVLDRIIGHDFSQTLRRSDDCPLTRSILGLCRIYQRPDGQRVHVKDELLAAIEAALGYEDFDGYEIPTEVELRQGENHLDPIGLYEQGELVAVVMPAKVGSS